jgi:proton-dependent oligopeptide transporter, POT family
VSQATTPHAAPNLDHLPPDARKTFLGHPVGLFVLFFTEMWERMSYYGMRALLVTYMTEYLFLDPSRSRATLGYDSLHAAIERVFGHQNVQQLASQVYGIYTGLVYLTPFFGGMLADRVLGQRKSVYLGGVLMMIGHFLMAVQSLFFVALFFLILGNGCFKPNISTQVGRLYGQEDDRRDGAFTIFYMGINLGAFLAPLVCGTLGQKVGWHYGFGAAGVGMACGLVVYYFGQRFLAPDTSAAGADADVAERPLLREEKFGIWALVFLCSLNIVFWAVYEQQGNTMQLWANTRTDWHIFGWEMPSTWYQSLNPFVIFTFAPLLNMLWAWQNKGRGAPTSVVKMATGCLLLGAGYMVMIGAALVVPAETRGSVLWLVGATFTLTIGELYLSPIGLSLVTKVAPKRYVSMLMGMWFLSSFFGNYLSGYLGTFYSVLKGNVFFAMLAGLASAAGVVMWLFNRPIQRWLHASQAAVTSAAKGRSPTLPSA